MKVLVVGSGGREHALVWKISQSPMVDKIYCAPGNAGIGEMAECVAIKAEDLDGLLDFAVQNEIGLTVVGPEVPLTMGIVDKFQEKGLKIFGPSGRAAEIEGSKTFAKDLMAKYGIPTAKYGAFTDAAEAKAFLAEVGLPCVVKADGLAAGKGVLICETKEEAETAVEDILVDNKFGNAGSRVVVEEFLTGQEVSMLAFSDGKTIVPMVSSQDHKRIWDGDKGLNTGGMGAYSPAPIYTADIHEIVVPQVLEATIKAMEQEGRPFAGILYAGLMLTADGPKVLEFNARFGDPETQAVLPRLKSDLVEIFLAIIDGRLAEMNIEWHEEAAVCVVMASGGYPESSDKGRVITGLKEAEEAGAIVFHAGTKETDGNIVTNGGRVLGISALGKDIAEAIENAYKGVKQITFENMQYRTDIGKKAFL
ncbi:MAG: phosphoribosylamine--glycine ligase [Peptococcaceae bacterium]|nr:phosphoribosylamine--glycine ligase [Peptococcaceae bacterium]MBQ5653143.1 phosphoribosylamine--glycine ligase [Peptococcaceae bacterium]